MRIHKQCWGKTEDGKEVDLYTLDNGKGMVVKITNYGGIVTSILVPDKDGKVDDVVLGFDSLSPYLREHPYFGALIGRYANRIAKGKFTLDGKLYSLAVNNGPNALHGGLKGFDKVIWEPKEKQDSSTIGLQLSYISADGEEGYPGKLKVTVIYELTHDNELKISYEAETDKPTPINLTNHSYFNLSGNGKGGILNHYLQLSAGKFTVVDQDLIPTGELKPVEGTPFDFNRETAIGARIDQVPGGYDHNFILTKPEGEYVKAAVVFEPESGRKMEVFTTQPGIQFYTGNFLDGSLKGKGGKVYHQHAGFCLETQHFPDSPNQPGFPNVILRPGEKYLQQTTYRFTVSSKE